MTTLVSRWGNSLAVRIPKSMAAELNVQDGDPVEVVVEDGALVVRPAVKRYAIEELVKGMSPKKRRHETDWGPPVGNEEW